MSNKRQQQQEDEKRYSCSDDDKRRRTFKSVVQDVMFICRLQTFMEPLIRRVVKEEVDSALRKYMINMTRSLELRFSCTISLPVFTGARIGGENGSNINVLLVDSESGKIVSNSPESSAKIKIVVLEGDLECDSCDDWTMEEFKNSIVKEREGKKALLNGDVFLTLANGIGVVGDVSFMDNSSWTRSRKFRLGAMIVDNFDVIRVRAAETDSFIVRDHRGELYKKHYPPCLSDEVWRLENIGKEGAFHKRLNREGVCTVKDFLSLYSLDPTRLRSVLGTGVSAKMWEVTVEHAQTCILDNKAYFYSPSGLRKKTGVIFNIVGQVMGLLCNCRYIASEKLSETEKDVAHELVILASREEEEVVLFDNEASCLDSISQFHIPCGDFNTEKASFTENIGENDNMHFNSFSPDMTPTIYSGSCLNDLGLTDSTSGRFGRSSNFSSQPPSTSFTDGADPVAQGLFDNEQSDYFNP